MGMFNQFTSADAPSLALDWNHEWLIPANTNARFPLKIFKDVALSGVYTVTVMGSTNIIVHYGNTRVRGGQSEEVDFPLAQSQETLVVQATGPGAATLTITFTGTGVADGYTCSTYVNIKPYRIELEPVTVAANGQGLIYNPCGVAAGGLAVYRVGVEPQGSLPDESIHWNIASGDVTFYGGNDTGREVIIRGGGAASDLKLEVDIAGATLTPKPYIHGKVLVPKTVQIRAYVICSNGVEAVSAATIEAWIAEANRIYRQAAITFTLVGSIQYIHGHETWFNIDDKDKFRDMCSYTNNTGGLELYCVNTLYGQANGIHSTLGMAVKFDAPMTTLAHEIGHACGLKDLYDYNAGDGLVSEDKAGALNWSGGVGTGYYPPTLAYRDLTYRCIMEMARPSAVRGGHTSGRTHSYERRNPCSDQRGTEPDDNAGTATLGR